MRFYQNTRSQPSDYKLHDHVAALMLATPALQAHFAFSDRDLAPFKDVP